MPDLTFVSFDLGNQNVSSQTMEAVLTKREGGGASRSVDVKQVAADRKTCKMPYDPIRDKDNPK